MTIPIPKRIAGLHARHNQITRGDFARFAEHRGHVMACLADAPAGRMAYVGAGNANDVELDVLAARYDELHLVDIDRRAIERAAARVPDTARVALHTEDLGGAGKLVEWVRRRPTPAVIAEEARAESARAAAALGGPFDTTLSVCVLSQIVWTAREIAGAHDPLLPSLAVAVASIHLRACLELTRPGGRLVVVSDTIARKPAELAALAPVLSDDALAELEARGLCFPCTGAGFVADTLLSMRPGADVRVSPPWVWTIAPARAHLTYAIRVTP